MRPINLLHPVDHPHARRPARAWSGWPARLAVGVVAAGWGAGGICHLIRLDATNKRLERAVEAARLAQAEKQELLSELEEAVGSLEALNNLRNPAPPGAVLALLAGSLPADARLLEISLTAGSAIQTRPREVPTAQTPGFNVRLDGLVPDGLSAVTTADYLMSTGFFRLRRVDEVPSHQGPDAPRRFVIDADFTIKPLAAAGGDPP
jgi:hypothetical protein